MHVVSDCPNCQHSFSWTMNQVERTPDGGRRPAKSPNCPNCRYDVTGTNDRSPRNFHYFAKTDDAAGMQKLLQSSIGNLFGLLRPKVNASVKGQSFNPLVVAAIYGSENATEFLLNNGVDRAAIPLALEKAKEFGHPKVTELLNAHQSE